MVRAKAYIVDAFDFQNFHGIVVSGVIPRRSGTSGSARHRDVDVFEDLFGRDAQNTIAGFDEIITFAATVLAAEMIDEAET